MLESRLNVLRQLQAEVERDENRHVPLIVGNVRGVTEVRFVALRENDNALVVERCDRRLAFIPLDFVCTSWREQRPHDTLHRIRVTRFGWRRVVGIPALAAARTTWVG